MASINKLQKMLDTALILNDSELINSVKELIQAEIKKINISNEKKSNVTVPKAKSSPVVDANSQFHMPRSKSRKRYDEHGNVIGSYGRSEPAQFIENKFTDDGTLEQDLREETDKQKKLIEAGKFAKTPRRPPAKKIRVECSKCHHTDEIFSSLMQSSIYTCLSCMRKGKTT